MEGLKIKKGKCPYCGETLPFEIDLSAGNQTYIEDCHVCCRPISVEVTYGYEGMLSLKLSREDD